MKHLVFLCTMDDADAAALDTGDGDLGQWIADALGAFFAADTEDQTAWAKTVRERYGMTPERAVDAFRECQARFVTFPTADRIEVSLYLPGNPVHPSEGGGA